MEKKINERINKIELRLTAIEEILNLNTKTWKERGNACPIHDLYTYWCKDCNYNKIINAKTTHKD